MSPKRLIIYLIGTLVIGFCVLWLRSPGKQSFKASQNLERDLGFNPPDKAAISVLGRDSGFNSETVYVKMTMDRKTWLSMFSKAPFEGSPTNVTTNPFFKIVARPSIVGWNPYKISEGVGGIV